jgi:hypothetical protein
LYTCEDWLGSILTTDIPIRHSRGVTEYLVNS